MIQRAIRHEVRVPLRYRMAGQEQWSVGEAINMSSSGLLFSSNELLEVDARLEITFQTNGAPLLERSTRQIRVVRRILSAWPETQMLFGAQFCL
ncbi:MAG TPA: PilZ domain-containing protein [Candidatus Limnocylindrales bacterium]|nr:PilZ domain-containing protein [Candidatus Limnocylindrales bacterium]